MELTNDMMVARAIVAENATSIAQLKILLGLARVTGIETKGLEEQIKQYEDQFPRAVAEARNTDPEVPWELCVDVAVQHEVHKFHLLFPGLTIGPLLLAASRAGAESMRCLVYMKEKTESTVQ